MKQHFLLVKYNDSQVIKHRLRIILEKDHSNWQNMIKSKESEIINIPDLVFAANAGLAAYKEWFDVIKICAISGYPFASTEYTEQSLDIAMLPEKGIIEVALKHARQLKPILHGPGDVCKLENIARYLNPFRAPGQREITMSNAPNYSNGFGMIIPNK